MNKTQAKILTIKSLAIIGFLVTLALCVWLLVEGIRRAPEAFSSLASIMESINPSSPATELTLTPEKSAVNSGEAFQINWSDAKVDGEYHFTYLCTEGVDLSVRGADGVYLPVKCTETLTVPGDVHGLYLSITSAVMRLTDVPLVVTFTSEDGEVTLKDESKITVANASIPVGTPSVPATTTPAEPQEDTEDEAPAKPKPVASAPKPVTTIVFPPSDPQGYVDLAVTTLGSGMIRNGVFTFTPTYDEDARNAIKFDIKNVGTKTSGTWSFKTKLPSGAIYESPEQAPLKPLEHVEFTLSFELDTSDDLVKITNTVETRNDTNSKNDSASWFVVVKD